MAVAFANRPPTFPLHQMTQISSSQILQIYVSLRSHFTIPPSYTYVNIPDHLIRAFDPFASTHLPGNRNSIVMNLLTAILLAVLCVQINASAISDLKARIGVPHHLEQQLQNTVRQSGGCNANVCFALEGSDSISPAAFRENLGFVLFVSRIVGDGINQSSVAAVQYANNVSPISSLTTDVDRFLLDVDGTTQQGGSQRFLLGALNFCMSELSNKRGQPVKIIILGSGLGDSGRSAVTQTALFRRAFGGSVSAVGVGDANKRQLARLTGGNSSLVFEVGQFFELLDAIEELFVEICA